MKSIYTYILLSIGLVLFSFIYYPKYKQGGSEATISWDVSGYYWYLPAVFIYHDLKDLKFSDSLRLAYGCSPDNQQITTLPRGERVLKYSCGMAIQYLPFFLIAHGIAEPFGFKADGLSQPYQMAIHIGGLFMMLLGLWFLRKILLAYFLDSTVSLVLSLLVLGTNYLNYAVIDIGMSHCWLFSCYCLLSYQSYLFYKDPKTKTAILIGVVLGIMVLTRPTEIIAIIIPLFWGLNLINVDAISERILFIKKHLNKYVLAIIFMGCLGAIQLMYWKYATGHWFVYSYGDQEFTWKHPHFRDYMFSYRSGWLLYCPMMILSYIGFIFLWKKKDIWWTVACFSFCYLWIVAAWDIWWYGGRAMIQGYVMLMFPLAAIVEFANKQIVTKVLFSCLGFVFIYANLWWVHGVHRGGIISATDMSEAYYKKVVGKWHIEEQDRKLLDVNDDFTGNKKDIDTLYNSPFSAAKDFELMENGHYYLSLPSNKLVIKAFGMKNKSKRNTWIRASANVECQKNNWDIIRMTQFGIRFFEKNRCVKDNTILLDRLFYKSPNQRIYIDAFLSPKKYDSLCVFFYNRQDAQGSFYVSDLLVESFH